MFFVHNAYLENERILVNIDDKPVAILKMVGYTEFITMGGYDAMKQALNVTDIKHANQRLILDAIFRSGTTSRTQLARELHLSKPAISDNLQPLLDLGIVTESGESSVGPSGGRKSILLRFNPMHRCVIAVNLNFSNPVFVLADLNGDVVQSFDLSIGPGTSVEDCRGMILEGIRRLLESGRPGSVYCIAVAAPGVFNGKGELTHFSASCGGPAWWTIDLKKTITEEFSLPVIIYNDVKAATLGEWRKGAGECRENLFYISTGLGIGSGIILNGMPLVGENFSAGEIYDYFDPADVHSGKKLEDTVCIAYLKEQCLREAGSPFAGRDQVGMEEIIAAYQEKNPAVCRVVDDVCRRLAILAHNYMNFISVNHVVFGGEYLPFGDCFAQHLTQLFDGSLWPVPSIRMSVLGKYAGIQGMIYLAREQYFRALCSS